MELLDKILKMAANKLLVEEYVKKEVAEWRYGVCEGCNVFDPTAKRCKACRCFMEVKTKSKINFNPVKMRFEITHCPMGKWNDLEITNEYRKIDGLTPITN